MLTELKRTPLYDEHVAAGARMVDFAGWDMPVLYGGILEETRAVRTAVGIFDISHMGRFRVEGSDATERLDALTTNNVRTLANGHAHYSLLTNANGGIIDDIIVYREAADRFLVVVNAGNLDRDRNWIVSHLRGDAKLDDRSEQTAMIAVQGPDAVTITAKLASDPGLASVGRFHFATGDIRGVPVTLLRTGYTGEDGFEIVCPSESAATIWRELVDVGAKPCGLGARDALRIEAGYPLYGHEIDDTTDPVSAALMWAVDLDKGPFTGSSIIAEIKSEGPMRRLVGLKLADRIVPRQGYTISAAGVEIGVVTSGVFSPTVNHSIAMGYVARAHAATGSQVEIAIRDRIVPATVVPKKALREC